MFTFIKLGRYGRFGNQLFQYAALRSLGLTNNCEIGLPNLKNISHHNQDNLLDSLSIPSEFFGKAKFYYHLTQKKFILKDSIAISKDFYNLKDGTDIRGYFQSIYYFKNYIDIIKKELSPKKVYVENAKNKINKIKEKYPNYQIVSLHLRRGDIVENNSNNYYGRNDMNFNSINDEYIFKSKSIFKNQKVKFLVFSGGAIESDKKGEDIDWCKRNLIGDEYIYLDLQSTIDDFSLISQCDHNIISRVSTFGWWAAYLNCKKNSKVIAPKIYDPDRPEAIRYMFYPNNWICI